MFCLILAGLFAAVGLFFLFCSDIFFDKRRETMI